MKLENIYGKDVVVYLYIIGIKLLFKIFLKEFEKIVDI